MFSQAPHEDIVIFFFCFLLFWDSASRSPDYIVSASDYVVEMTLNYWSFCLCLPNAGITGMYQPTPGLCSVDDEVQFHAC